MFPCCSSIPRPEYPRPDRQRGRVEGVEWLNLNGSWQFRFDRHRVGVAENWAESTGPEWREQIIVPFCWESLAAWAEGDAACNAHYYSTRVFIDPLTDTLAESGEDEPRQALIVIRVEDPMDNREQPVGKQWGWYTPTSGIWQTVFIEPRSAAYIESFRIFTDIDKSEVRFEVMCEGIADSAAVSVEIFPPEAAAHTHMLTGADNLATGAIFLDPLTLWDTYSPKLYHVLFQLRHSDGRLLDEVRGYFGMRKISTAPADDPTAPGMLCLNNQPIYLRGALYQSYHPAGVYTAPDAATLRRDIACAMEAGFDFLRIHIKLDDPLLLYYADTLGMLLMQDFPNFGEGGDTPLGRRRFVEMLKLGIKRDFNHPSIISWCIFNESWGFGGQVELIKWFARAEATTAREQAAKIANAAAFKWIHETWLLAKQLDPTRLIEDMIVVIWDHLDAYGHVDTDINSWHFYIDDYERAKAHIENVVAQTYHGSTFNFVEGFSQRDAPLINSEYGGVGALDGDRDISWSFRFLTNELRRHGRLSAYIYTELTDLEWEYNGFLNYDRTPKEFGYSPRLVNQGDVLPINAPPIRVVAPGETIEVEVLASHFSRRPHDDVTLHWQYSGIDTLGICHNALTRGREKITFAHRRVELARRIQIVIPEEIMLCTLVVSAVTPSGEVIAENFVQHFACDTPPPEREDRGHSLVLRRRVADWDSAEWPGTSSSREDAAGTGTCHGQGTGFFEWIFSDEALRKLVGARRVRVLVEVSARREGTPQTDGLRHPSHFELLLNGVPVHCGILPDHPHDSRGALSYLHGGRGAYGFLVRATIENGLLQNVAATAATDGILRFRCAVNESPTGGLTVYDYDAGRYPIAPTVCIEWEKD